MKKSTFLGKYWEYIAAFLIPIIIVLIHCIVRKVWMFGDNCMLRGDAGIQYIYVFEELWNKVHSGDFSFYSWNALGGFDFYLNALYYTISPATIIILLLPKACMEDALQFFMVLKWALMAVSSVYFFMHTKFNTLKENKRFVSLVLGLCYAMSNFFLQLLNLFNWLDTLVLFPLLLLLIEQLVDTGKWKLYYVTLTLAIFCNFYMAFPMCIFLFFWYILQLCELNGKKRMITFFLSSLASGISATAVILPSLLNVSGRYSAYNKQTTVKYIGSILSAPWDIIKKFFIFDSFYEEKGWYTSFYFSITAIVLSMFFCFIKMNKKVKRTKLTITVFIMLSLFVGVLNYVWHAFSIPHGITNRYGFALVLMLLILALDVMINIEQIKLWQCILTLGVNLGLIVYTFFNLSEYEEFFVYLVTILLAVFNIIVLILYCRKSIEKKTVIIVLSIVCLGEICINGYYQLFNYNVLAPDQFEYIEETEKVVDENGISLELGERVAFMDTNYNFSLKKNMADMSGFLSFANGKMNDLCYALGMHTSNDAGYIYTAYSPLVNLMFNVRYGTSLYLTEVSDAVEEVQGENVSIYRMQRLAGLGYMVENSISEWKVDTSTFEIQNEFIQQATGLQDENLFEIIIPEDIEAVATIGKLATTNQTKEDGYLVYGTESVLPEDAILSTFTVEKDMDLYLSLKETNYFSCYVTVDEEVVFNDLEKSSVSIHIGKVKKGQVIKICCINKDMVGQRVQLTMQLANFNEDVFAKAYEELSESTYQIKEMKSDMIDGEIEAKEDGIMMTSVQAVDGFEVFVDGEKTEYETIGGALIGVPLEKGKHTVTFRYQTPYAVLGWIISGVSILGVALVCILQHKKKDTEACLS